MAQAAKLKRAAEQARAYVAKIGKPQHHFGDSSVGDLRSVAVKTEIHHQESSGSTNYWKDSDFDDALARVVRRRFTELAKEALDLMEADYAQSRIAEKESLLAQLAEIEALEASTAGVA